MTAPREPNAARVRSDRIAGAPPSLGARAEDLPSSNDASRPQGLPDELAPGRGRWLQPLEHVAPLVDVVALRNALDRYMALGVGGSGSPGAAGSPEGDSTAEENEVFRAALACCLVLVGSARTPEADVRGAAAGSPGARLGTRSRPDDRDALYTVNMARLAEQVGAPIRVVREAVARLVASGAWCMTSTLLDGATHPLVRIHPSLFVPSTVGTPVDWPAILSRLRGDGTAVLLVGAILSTDSSVHPSAFRPISNPALQTLIRAGRNPVRRGLDVLEEQRILTRASRSGAAYMVCFDPSVLRGATPSTGEVPPGYVSPVSDAPPVGSPAGPEMVPLRTEASPLIGEGSTGARPEDADGQTRMRSSLGGGHVIAINGTRLEMPAGFEAEVVIEGERTVVRLRSQLADHA